jgi:hypothetical protein
VDLFIFIIIYLRIELFLVQSQLHIPILLRGYIMNDLLNNTFLFLSTLCLHSVTFNLPNNGFEMCCSQHWSQPVAPEATVVYFILSQTPKSSSRTQADASNKKQHYQRNQSIKMISVFLFVHLYTSSSRFPFIILLYYNIVERIII